LVTQVLGSLATIGWVAVTSLVMFGALKAIGRLRVNIKAETGNNFIDNYEHGQTIWPDVLPLPDQVEVTGTTAGKRASAPAAGD
jgi:Amt family ammonium transporter